MFSALGRWHSVSEAQGVHFIALSFMSPFEKYVVRSVDLKLPACAQLLVVAGRRGLRRSSGVLEKKKKSEDKYLKKRPAISF